MATPRDAGSIPAPLPHPDDTATRDTGHTASVGEPVDVAIQTAAESATPVMPPGFTFEGELGRGGMGVVYLARQVGLNRPVALKMLLAAVQPMSVIRFLAEAETVASVKHPNVVSVYQFGEDRGRPFLAMEFCPGGDLAIRARSGRLDHREAGELMAAVADGVNAAHAAGIVHRDLKPHNVLLADDGTPKVTDFGLAKQGTGSDLTPTQAVLGTPAYMSPEQAGGAAKFVGPEADVWALGVMLYELLTGTRPFPGPSHLDFVTQILGGRFSPPRTARPDVPRDLELIVLKCLRPEPRERYATAGELATDLRNWLAGRPLVARPVGGVESAVKWARRNKPLAATVAGVGLLLATATGVSIWLAIRAARAETATADQLERTRRAEVEARQRGHEAATALTESQALTGRLDASLAESRRRAALGYAAYGQLCATASALANAPDYGPTDRLRGEYARLAGWIALTGEAAIRTAAADYEQALGGWTAGPPATALKERSLQLARACRDSWLKSVEAEQPEVAEEIRRRLYARACAAAESLLAGEEVGRVALARREFWELYWGELAIVESNAVLEAMVAVGDILKEWPVGKPPPKSLAAAVAALKRACETE